LITPTILGIVVSEKATALVLRTTDWSETSRIATLWTREFGKVRVLAKGGRRLKSKFESALDLLTCCRIVLLRKSSGNLDLLTEAQVAERFPRLRTVLPALYAGYYMAELLADLSQDYDPHPRLFDEAIDTLRDLGEPEDAIGPRLARFELVLLREFGYLPALDACARCENQMPSDSVTADLDFSPSAGGVLCRNCRRPSKDDWILSAKSWRALRTWVESADAWNDEWDVGVRTEIRRTLNHYMTYLLGRRPRLQTYLGS
jgi:DNA repair protein RecO (recombination protein O)